MTKQTNDRATIERKMAVDATVAWMDQFIQDVEGYAKTLKTQRAQFVEACKRPKDGSLAKPISVLSWFINDVNNMRSQGRLDLVVNHAAALALTEKQ
jgi:hypothetical protein